MELRTPAAGLRALLAGLIDYAGLFPPAALPLDAAFTEYLRHRAEPEAWMLGRFVVPAARLAALGDLLDATNTSVFPLAVLGAGGTDAAAFDAALSGELDAMRAFAARFGARAPVEAFEVRLPVSADVDALAALLRRADAAFRGAGFAPAIAVEVPTVGPIAAEDAGWTARFAAAADAVVASGLARVGLKIRCGGADAAQFPSSAQIADAILRCAADWLSLKATAGLHHPLRHHNAEVGGMMHGFLNVFGAGLLAHVAGAGRADLIALLDDEDAAHFRFDDAGFAWLDTQITTAQIEAARATLLPGFGSCSFDEPRADLAALGLLPTP